MARATSSLPVPVLAQDQHRGIRGRHGLHLAQHPLQGGAAADDLGAVVPLQLLLQVELFLGQLVPERLDLLVGEGVVQGDGDLHGDPVELAGHLGGKGPLLAAAEVEGAHDPGTRDQRDRAQALEALAFHHRLEHRRREPGQAGPVEHQRAAQLHGAQAGPVGGGEELVLLHEAAAGGEVQVADVRLGAAFGQDQHHAVVLEMPAQGGGDGLEQGPGVAVLDQFVVDLQQDPLLVALPGQAQVERVQLAQAQDAQGERGQEAGQEHQVGAAQGFEGALAMAGQAQPAHQVAGGCAGAG